ncbi:hypothetical protein B0A48_16886 [Cryoendolithus antarcticus]|uniref:Uncharacterized protein n=1 Tax=Cryoendolithus antarcticus TaxID=1507870 RepID=A0A1V8SD53_9PEZI|nr:hypothetical protein B0A48_16886 [Cryoendolithus antarcticus]OQO17689.1 hypothetical protein B0A51_15226 [Rachicladosporium sp. CCFEE 5018]
MSTPTALTIRRYVLTGSVAAITATGVWYGAGLKTRQERKQVIAAVVEAPLAEQLEQMALYRASLVRQRDGLQTKIDQLTGKAEPPKHRGR